MIWIYSIVIPVIVLSVLLLYNSLTRGRNYVEDAYANIEVFIRKRHDLIPNLIAIAEAHFESEKEILIELTQLRTQSQQEDKVDLKALFEEGISQQTQRLVSAIEAYPELTSAVHFQKLMEELSEAEDGLERARRYYNGCVRDFNTRVQQFPGSAVAGVLGFKTAPFFFNPQKA